MGVELRTREKTGADWHQSRLGLLVVVSRDGLGHGTGRWDAAEGVSVGLCASERETNAIFGLVKLFRFGRRPFRVDRK